MNNDITRDVNSRTPSKFYVMFHNFPDNDQNTLGGYVTKFQRPSIQFDMIISGMKHKANNRDIGKMELGSMNMTLRDDVGGTVMGAILKQCYRQAFTKNQSDVKINLMPKGYTFSVVMESYDQRGNVIEGYRYKNCFISNVVFDENDVSDASTAQLIQLTVEPETIDVFIFGEYVSVY